MVALNTGIMSPTVAPGGARTALVAIRFNTTAGGDPTAVDSPQGATVTRNGNIYTFNIGVYKDILYASPGFTANPTVGTTDNADAGTVAVTYAGTQNSLFNVNALFLVQL